MVIEIVKSMLDMQRGWLEELNLAKNLITCVGAEKIAVLLTNTSQILKILSLHWNQIKAKGGTKIAEALT